MTDHKLGWLDFVEFDYQYRVLKMCRRPVISPATSGWAPSTNLSKIKIEVGKTEMLQDIYFFLVLCYNFILR